MNKILNLTAIFMCLIMFSGCGEKETVPEPEDEPQTETSTPYDAGDNTGYVPESTQITYLACTSDPGSYNVYIITIDKLICYDLTDYWKDHSGRYHYFEDSLPPEGKYTLEEYDLTAEQWKRLIATIRKNKFSNLPEDLGILYLIDGPVSYIEVKSKEETHMCGGISAGLGNSKNQKQYAEIVSTLEEIINESREASGAGSGEPPVQSAEYYPATADLFENLDYDICTFEELENLIGPYQAVNPETDITMYGWELEDGGMAWITIGPGMKLRDVELWYDDHFVILKSSIRGIPEGADTIYRFTDPKDFSSDESDLFNLVSMMIHNSTETIDYGSPYSQNDFCVVCQYGEAVDPDEPAALGQDSAFSDYRMQSSELVAFYREVLDEEREFEPESDPDYRPETGIICLKDGYCYSFGSLSYTFSRMVSVAEGSSVIIVNTEIIFSMSEDYEEELGYVRFAMEPTDSEYGYRLVDYTYYHAS